MRELFLKNVEDILKGVPVDNFAVLECTKTADKRCSDFQERLWNTEIFANKGKMTYKENKNILDSVDI